LGAVKESKVMKRVTEFRDFVAAQGLNLFGVLSANQVEQERTGYARRSIEDSSSILLCGSGGRSHWQHVEKVQLQSTTAEENPIEAGAWKSIEEGLPLLPEGSFQLPLQEVNQYNLRLLGEAAGFGRISPELLMMIHPIYGPWISIRSMVVVSFQLPVTKSLDDYDPCTHCEKPCLQACPAHAYSQENPWNVTLCGEHRLKEKTIENDCADACRSRLACVVGPEHAYSSQEMRHRHRSSLPTLKKYL
jgi:hypothetical protein